VSLLQTDTQASFHQADNFLFSLLGKYPKRGISLGSVKSEMPLGKPHHGVTETKQPPDCSWRLFTKTD
jgi:hypothetical protein